MLGFLLSFYILTSVTEASARLVISKLSNTNINWGTVKGKTKIEIISKFLMKTEKYDYVVLYVT